MPPSNLQIVHQTKTPSLPAYAKALLADPFSLGDEIPAWQPPAAPPERRTIEDWIATLEAMLTPAPSAHVGFWIGTWANTLAMRQGQTAQMASRTDGWLLACGQLPADLWTEGGTELLRRKFMPSPGELWEIVGRKLEERRRMLQRAKALLGGNRQDPKKPFVREPLDVRLRSMRDSLKRHGFIDRAARAERELAALESREPEAWATAPTERATPQERPAQPKQSPLPPHMRASLKAALADKHRAQGNEAYADRLEREVAALGYSRPGREQPPMPDEVPEGVEP